MTNQTNQYNLRDRSSVSPPSANIMPHRKVKENVSYVNFLVATSNSEDDSPTKKLRPEKAPTDRKGPSWYRLAAHNYMIVRKQGLISGPVTRTRTIKIPRKKQESD